MRASVLAAVLVSAVLLGAAPDAQAASAYCSPSGDACKAVSKHKGKWRIELSTAALYGPTVRYRLCVRPPDGRETCKTFRLRRARFGTYASRVTWSAHFPTDGGRGSYRVRWDHDGITYGPSLTFRR